jgi:hypothetical protein
LCKIQDLTLRCAVDVALNVAIQVATGEPVDVGAAVKEAAIGVINPAATVKKVAKLGKALAQSSGKGKTASTATSAGGKGCSFTPETMILTKDGYKTIIEVNVGDVVLSKNDQTGEVSWRMVTDTFKDWHGETITFTVVDENGVEESITTTAEHPFYIDNQGWLPAGDISTGTVISGPKSENNISIVGIQVNQEPQYAYNFTVDVDHTYFVGKTNMWVHNSCSLGHHGNSRKNSNPQHNYDILNSKGEVRKNGVGTGLAEGDVSKRANSQLEPGDSVRITDRHPGGKEGNRGVATDLEKKRSLEHGTNNELMDKHIRPKTR